MIVIYIRLPKPIRRLFFQRSKDSISEKERT